MDARWNGVRRDYGADDVVALRGPAREEHTLARRGAEALWRQVQVNTDNPEEWAYALGVLTGNQAVQQVRAGLKAIYLSGWMVPTVADVPTIVSAPADSRAVILITSDVDHRDKPFLTGGRTAEGFYEVKPGIGPVLAGLPRPEGPRLIDAEDVFRTVTLQEDFPTFLTVLAYARFLVEREELVGADLHA